jgi:predicted peptidase
VFAFLHVTTNATFMPREVTVSGRRTIYRLYVPPDASAAKAPLPLVLFLHGAGESGVDGVAPTTVGIGPAIVRDPARFPALVVFPQASVGYGWKGFNLDAAFAALADVEASFAVDPDRVSVTGISMGGYGTWLAAMRDPERFSAIAPVCGGLDVQPALPFLATRMRTREVLLDAAAARIAALPQWVFHGDADDIIPVSESRELVAALERAGAPVRYTEYPRVRHNSWDRAYAEAELPAWLLGERGSAR